MPDWDEDSPRLRQNLALLLAELTQSAKQRQKPTLDLAKRWQFLAMQGLAVPDPAFVGAFRGEKGLEDVQVRVGTTYGVDSILVPEELENFETTLQGYLAEMDKVIPAGKNFSDLTEVETQAVIDLCAWTHAEWIRIHPFANGNGRTARCWANFIAKRYGLPAFIRLRPRPTNGYGAAGKVAMLTENWKPTADVFARLLGEYPDSP